MPPANFKCPKCGRATWSAKWGTCSSCGHGASPSLKDAMASVEAAMNRPAKAPRQRVTRIATPVAETETSVANGVTPPKPGEECPTCRRRYPMTAAMRMRVSREKAKVVELEPA